MADGKAGCGLGVLTVDDRDVWTEVSGFRLLPVDSTATARRGLF